MSRVAVMACAVVLVVAADARAQTHAVDGAIEGQLHDAAGAVLPGASVQAANVNTGLTRSLRSDASGRFQILLLPPGRYGLDVAHPGFRTLSLRDVDVRAGETVRLDLILEPGPAGEVVTVTADLPPTRPGQTDAGRTLSAAELSALPLVLRNPLNLVLLAPGVTGTEQDELNQPRLVANGTQVRNAYLLDGATNTQRDRVGHRLIPLSPVMIGELKVTASGPAPEFGLASGMVVNVVTPSGTNNWHGLARTDISRPSFVARPPLLPAEAPRPASRSTVAMLAAGGPVQRDRLHVYAGYHYIRRDASTELLAIAADDAKRLHLTLPENPQVDRGQSEHFAIARIDQQVASAHRASYRFTGFFNDSPSIGAGGLTAPDRTVDLFARMASGGFQLNSIVGPAAVHEVRAQYARRITFRRNTAVTAAGPAIDIPGVASFGGPYDALQGAESEFVEGIWQVANAYTRQAGRHTIKAGLDTQWILDRRTNTLRRAFTFPTVDAYLAALDGDDPWAYTRYLQDTGDGRVRYATTFASVFAQDDVRFGSRVSALFGLRYDVFGTPHSSGDQPAFATDWNNLAPRVGVAWSLDGDSRTVVRASVGRMFDPLPLALYEDAIVRGRSGRVRTDLLRAVTASAPPFPHSAVPFDVPPSIIEFGRDVETPASWQVHVQLDRAIGRWASAALAWTRTDGRYLPVLIDENLVPTGAPLADGRPTYTADVTAATRVDPAYNHIDVVRSIGRSRYDAVVGSLRLRWREWLKLEASYTGARSRDNAPLTNAYVQGSPEDRLSDPSNIERDRGATPFSQPHAFAVSVVAETPRDGRGVLAAISGNTTLGAVVIASSGLPANLRSNRDLNGDGQSNDRPLGVARNAGRVGRIVSFDLKIDRRLRTTRGGALSIGLALKNVLNRRNVSQVNRVIPTDASGHPLAPIPALLPATATYEPRRLELTFGFRF